MRRTELRIEDVAFGGKGVARENGKAIFVPFTIEGELVAARVTRDKKNFAEAEPLEILEASPERVEPPCPYFGRCGGCSYQHIRYEHQLQLKARQVEETLRRIGRFEKIPMRPIVPSPGPYEYRNRITVHCDEGAIGFFRRDEHRLIDVVRCPIAKPEVNAELKKLRASRPRFGHYTLRASAGPRVFSQTNDLVAELLREHVAGILPARGPLLLDAFCGAGFFSKPFVDRFESVVGIDWDEYAIAAAQKNSAPNERYLAGNVDQLLRAELDTAKQPTTIIVDPPAVGLSEEVRGTLRDFPAADLIYISCNPPTLARDLAALRDAFQIESVTPFDMFPQTAEIEVVAFLRARTSDEKT